MYSLVLFQPYHIPTLAHGILKKQGPSNFWLSNLRMLELQRLWHKCDYCPDHIPGTKWKMCSASVWTVFSIFPLFVFFLLV